MTTKIFISYRRDDSAGHAGRILDRLVEVFGRERLFFDVDSVPLGENFPRILREEVSKCSALLAMIGANWIDARDDDGKRRLENQNDFVRIEIAAALQRDIPVIPIFLDGASILRAEQLPHELKELASRNGLEVHHASFHGDLERLIRDLKEQLGAHLDGKHRGSQSPNESLREILVGCAQRVLILSKYVAVASALALIAWLAYIWSSLQQRQPVAGTWDIEMACPSGAAVHEVGAKFTDGSFARQFTRPDGSSGSTELLVEFVADNSIALSGRVVFRQTDIYDISAKATRNGNEYSGVARFGAEDNCALTAKRRVAG